MILIKRLKGWANILNDIFRIVRPWGIKKLFWAVSIVLIQAVFQIVSVLAISPLAAIVLQPNSYQENKIVKMVFNVFAILPSINIILIFVVSIQLATMLVNIFSDCVRAKIYARFSAWLRTKSLTSVSLQPYEYFIKRNASIIYKRAEIDTSVFCNAIFWPCLEIFSRIIIATGLIISCFFLNPEIAMIIGFLGILYYIGVFFLLGKLRKKISSETQIFGEFMAKISLQLLQGIKSIKVNRCEEVFLKKYANSVKPFSKNQAIIPILGSFPKYLIEFTAISSIVFILWYKGISSSGIDSGTLATLGAIGFATSRLLPILQQIYAYTTGMGAALYTIDSLKENQMIGASSFIKEEPIEENSGRLFENSIEFRNLQYSYSSNLEKIKWPDFIIKKGETIGICGPSGCGKSTFLDLLLGLLKAEEGEILIDRIPLEEKNIPIWQSQIGYVGQDLFVIDGTLKENIIFGNSTAEKNETLVEEAAKKANIHKFIMSLPDGYQTMAGDRGIKLSGGQKQRIVIARALVRDPKVLILDEATSSLDGETEKQILKTLYEISSEITIVMVTHRRETLDRADRVIELDEMLP